jgi:long-chain acyl-CoA synthetase
MSTNTTIGEAGIDSGVRSGGDVTVPEGPLAAWLLEHAEVYADEPMAYVKDGSGAFVPRTYAEVFQEVREVAGGLLDLGLSPGDRVAIRAETRYEWSVVDYACALAGLVLVPVYPSFSPEQTAFVLEDSGARVLVHEGDVPVEAAGVVEHTVDIEALPRSAPDDLPGLTADDGDTFTIVYTSGTTGMPKGVELTHRNLLTQAAQFEAVLPPFGPGDVVPVYLPLNHIMQRVLVYAGIQWGSAGAYTTPQTLLEDLKAVKPDGFSGVPRIYRRMYQGVREQVEATPGARGRLGAWALEVAIAYGRAVEQGEVPPGLRAKHAVAERLVYRRLREALGFDNVRYAGTGAATIDAEVLYFFWGIGVPMLEAYGATETSAGVTFSRLDDFHPGTVGLPAPGVEVRLADDGEVLVRGPNVMKGYWNNPAATAEAIDADGWYHTGDVGEWQGDHLRIVDRKKRIQVLDTGKNVYPAPIENALRRSPYVAEAMVVAEGRKYVTALLQPNYPMLVAFAEAEGIAVEASAFAYDAMDEIAAVSPALLEEPAVRALYQGEIDAANRTLADYEQVKRFDLVERAFSVEASELTPTLKKRRGTIEEHFADRIDGLYA